MIAVKFGDARRGQYHVDAHPDDPEVKKLIERGALILSLFDRLFSEHT